jgi:hypothetical protein
MPFIFVEHMHQLLRETPVRQSDSRGGIK